MLGEGQKGAFAIPLDHARLISLMMQNMPVPKIIIQSCAFYRHRYISTAVNTSLVNLSLVFKTVFILLITLLKFFYGAIFSILIYSQSPSTF